MKVEDDEFDIPMEGEGLKKLAKKTVLTKASDSQPYFLEKIKILPLKTNNLLDRGDEAELQGHFKRLISKRENIVREVRRRSQEYSLKDCAIACGVCDTILCQLKHVEMLKEKDGFCEIRSTMISLYDIEEQAISEERKQDDPFISNVLKKVKNRDEVTFKFLGCPEDHISGFTVNCRYYLNKHSKVVFKYPENVNEEWTPEMRKDDFKLARAIEEKSRINIDWSDKVTKDDINC